MSDAARTKRLVTESLVLAFASSRAKTLVGTDALRSVIDFRYRELTRGGGFDLAPLAELLQEQPGYEPAPVSGALFRFKSWEPHLGLEIKLPPALAEVPEVERVALLDECVVPSSELARVLKGGEGASSGVEGPPEEQLADGTPALRKANEKKSKKSRRTRSARRGGGKAEKRPPIMSRPAAMVAGAIGTLGVAFAAYYAVTKLSPPSIDLQPVATSFAAGIPIADAQRLGTSVSATLTDPSWLRRPAKDRQRDLEQALLRLPDATGLVLKDKRGQMVGSAQRVGRNVVVKLP